jgi:integrase
MASVDRRANGKWRARWREYPGGPQKTRSFDRKIDAQRWLTKVEHDLMTGGYVDPSAGQLIVRTYSESWLSRRHWRPSTRDRIERELRLHILPSFGNRPLAAIRRSDIEQWVAVLEMQASSARRVAETFATMLRAAVDDGLIARNPAERALLPTDERAPVVPLEATEVRAITHAALEPMRAAIVLSAGTGLRQGEAMAVTADRVDFLRREVRIDRQLWTPSDGPPVFAVPKSKRGYRTIALSELVVDTLAAHMAAFGPGKDGLLFHTQGRPIGRATLSQRFKRAATAAGVVATWHDLRHHHASVLLSAGVSPALVAERLGHDVKTLLATYAHVIRADEDRVRSIVDATLGGTAEDWLRTEAV